MSRCSHLFAGIVAAVLTLSACSEQIDKAPEYMADEVLRRGNVEEPETLDPMLADDTHAFNVLVDLYEGLVAEDANGRLVPGVAQSWSISDDGLSYQFQLRSEARWSNGEPVTASHFVNALQRLASPATVSTYAFLFEPIANFKAIGADEAPLASLGVKAEGPLKLTIKLANPNPYFLRVLALPVAFPLFDPASDPSHFQRPETFIGNGAYVLSERAIGRPIRLERNPHYWDVESVKIPAVEYLAIDDGVAEYNLYRSDALHITASIPTSHFQNARKTFGDEVRVAPSLGLYYLAFDLTETPFDNLELRRALSMAINREQLATLIGRGERPAYSVIPPGIANYPSPQVYKWRQLEAKLRDDLARKALAKAGYNAENAPKIKLTYDTGSIHEKVAITVSAMWREKLGLDVELEKKEWKHFLETRSQRSQWQIMRFSWVGDYNDPSTFTDIFNSASAQNLSRFSNSEYDDLLSRAAVEVDLQQRASLLAQAENLLLENYPIAPIYFYVSKHLVKPRIAGFENSVINRYPSKYLSFREPASAH